MSGLIDTAVLVDFLRGYPPALTWLADQTHLAVSPITWLEIIEGAPNGRAQRAAVKLLHRFERIDLTSEDFDWAIAQALKFKLSHGTDMMDCLIASTARRLNLPLYTQNKKHFEPLLGPLVQTPY